MKRLLPLWAGLVVMGCNGGGDDDKYATQAPPPSAGAVAETSMKNKPTGAALHHLKAPGAPPVGDMK